MPSGGEEPKKDQIDKFIGVLFGEDELGAVVRAHIHVEAKLLELLGLLVKDESYLRRLNLEFSQHVDLAIALGLNSEHAKGLRAFGNLRNDFAHKLNSELSKERVTSLYEALSSKDKESVHKAFKKTATENQIDITFNDLTPKKQFILITTALHASLEVVIAEVRKRRLR
jgi:hypothetical protein